MIVNDPPPPSPKTDRKVVSKTNRMKLHVSRDTFGILNRNILSV